MEKQILGQNSPSRFGRTMKNYRISDGCHNCIHRFLLRDFGTDDRYYCTFNALPRPASGSDALKEEWGGTLQDDNNDTYNNWMKAHTRDREAWVQWSKDREVEVNGLCDDLEKEKT